MSGSTTTDRADELASHFAREASGDVRADRGVWVATSPESLDVMGGLSDAYGSFSLTYPLAGAVTVGLQRRDDAQLVFIDLPSESHPGTRRWQLPLDRLAVGLPEDRGMCALRDELLSQNQSWVLPLAGALAATRGDPLPAPDRGWTVISRDQFEVANVDSYWQAASAATVAALHRAQNKSASAEEMGVLCQRAARLVGGVPYGVSGFLGSLTGEAGKLLHLRCRPHEILGMLALPAGVTVCGIDCGQDRAAALNRFLHARTTMLMACTMIRRLEYVAGEGGAWKYLAEISIADFVTRIRDYLPVRIRGQMYLDRFGHVEDPLCPIDPTAWYRIRSRAEHPIYENVRVQEFVEGLNRSARTGDLNALGDAGEVTYVSHWSYGHRCGLGDLVTDTVVTSLRRAGRVRGIYGARVGGIGSGGMVTVIMRDTPSARDALHEAMDSVSEPARSGLRIHQGTLSGPCLSGVQEVFVR